MKIALLYATVEETHKYQLRVGIFRYFTLQSNISESVSAIIKTTFRVLYSSIN